MERNTPSRRQFGTTLAAAVTVGLAGCSDDTSDDDDGDGDAFDLDDPGNLTLFLENEDGEPVSEGIEVRIEHEEEDYSSNHAEEISDGELADVSLLYEGEYAITVVSLEDEFDDIEESVTLEEDEDEEETLVLEGATPDSEREDDVEEDADEGDEDENGEDDEGDEDDEDE
jgi:hypothetical protein